MRQKNMKGSQGSITEEPLHKHSISELKHDESILSAKQKKSSVDAKSRLRTKSQIERLAEGDSVLDR